MITERSILSPTDRQTRRVKIGFSILAGVVLVALAVAGLGPLLWLAKASVSTSQEILRDPLALWPESGATWSNYVYAWVNARVGTALFNSAMLALGSIIGNLFVCVTLAYVLSVLRPRWGRPLTLAILATLFIPGIISLIPLYLTVLDLPPFGVSLGNTYWAVWLPAAVNPFNVLVMMRFFDGIPRELFDAARVDGAGAWRVLYAIVLPLSKPILGVIAIFSGFNAWKDFLWPKLVLPSPSLRPISVSLEEMSRNTDLGVQMAALSLSIVFPLILFMLFQRQFLNGVAMSGGVKA